MRQEAEQFERIPTFLFETPGEACRALATEVASLIRERQTAGQRLVLGLATGSTPVPFYAELIRMHRDEGLSFRNVTSFNLDEYYGLEPDHPESYYRFMQDQLFSHIDIPADQVHVPPGTVPRDEVFAACREYEAEIEAAGGIDLQILGIGRTGHIGFNEPGSSEDSPTRLITLDRITREDAARDFLGIENVPRFAITMGVGTILKARKIVLMAWGNNKAPIVARAVEGDVTDSISASFLQHHPRARFFLDQGASKALTRVRLPWLVGMVEWDADLARRAITWLSNKLEKPVLKLQDEDYNEHGMADLLIEEGPAYELNIGIFNHLQHTITGWPGGKPGHDDSNRPERAAPHPKRVLVFSPEPRDEMRAMGGTLTRLADQGHHVEVLFLTSGNLGVPDDAVTSFAEILRELAAHQPAAGWKDALSLTKNLLDDLKAKGRFAEDTPALRRLKSLVRRSEARHALQSCGIAPDSIMFLDLPFYEEGRYRRFKPSETDVDLLVKALIERKPHQIYLTGRASDPSSVAGVCFHILERTLERTSNDPWRSDCRAWLYRSGEQPLEAHEIDMAVPMSPDQLNAKRSSLTHYTLDEDTAAPGQRDQATARQYDQLGLANYEAIEAFERLF